MRIDRIINEEFKSNTYIINATAGKEVVVIDPGSNAVISYLETNNYTPRYILLTHEHFDHISGTNILKEKYPGCEIVCSYSCAENIINARLNFSHYRGMPYISVPADISLSGNSFLNWMHKIDYYEWEGHSPGGMLFFINDAIFCGDQFIKGIKTVTNLPGSKKEKVKECFNFIKNNFSAEVILYPGHGECMTVDELKIWQ